MANSKISALTAATTPLAGTEVLPVVQSSATTQVTVANLTAGRAVSALSYASTTGAAFGTTSGSVGVGMTPSTWGSAYKAVQMGNTSFSGAVVGYIGNAQTYVTSNAYHNGTNWTYTNTSGAAYYAVQGVTPSHNWYIAASGTAGTTITWTTVMTLDAASNLQMQAGAVMPYAPAPAAISAAATLSNANIQGQIISATGTTYTITMPLGTTLETLVTSWAAVNVAYDFFVINTATGIITMAVNTGVTSLGLLTIAAATSAHFRIRRTAANTFVLYRLV